MSKFNFGRRKITQMNYTFKISLPLPWPKNHNLKRKSEVELVMNESGDLILRPVLEGQG